MEPHRRRSLRLCINERRSCFEERLIPKEAWGWQNPPTVPNLPRGMQLLAVRRRSCRQRGSEKCLACLSKSFSAPMELADVLKSARDHKMNRKAFNDAGYSLASAIGIAKEDPKKFGNEQNKAQGSVWLK
jgi:hypothetical protein